MCSIISAVSVSKPEEERLRKENENLKGQIQVLKMQLVMAEVANGGLTLFYALAILQIFFWGGGG